MIAAGVNAKALSTYMGHANISITLDKYGHLMPGNEDESAALLDAYLVASERLQTLRTALTSGLDHRRRNERTGRGVNPPPQRSSRRDAG